MRRFLFYLHSWMGLIAGLCLIVIGLTGSALVFRQEIECLVMPQRVRAADQSAERLDLDALAARLEEQLSDYEPVGWRPSRSQGRNDEVLVAPHAGGDLKVLWIDPACGTIHGTPASSSQTLTGWLLELHYTLLGGHAGTLVAGVFAALLCLLGISGVWIYRNFWKSLLLLRWNSSGRIFFSDLHKMVGISSAGFNLILGFTGAYWNLTHIIGHFLNGPDPPPPKIEGRVRAGTLSLEGLLEQARTQIPGFEWTYVSLPSQDRRAHNLLWQAEEPTCVARAIWLVSDFQLPNGIPRRSGRYSHDRFLESVHRFVCSIALRKLWSVACKNSVVPGRASSGYPGDHGIYPLVEEKAASPSIVNPKSCRRISFLSEREE